MVMAPPPALVFAKLGLEIDVSVGTWAPGVGSNGLLRSDGPPS